MGSLFYCEVATEIDKPTDIFGSISTALQGAGLRTSNFTSHFQMEKESAKSSTGLSNALCDIHKALEDACQSHNLPFAQTWTPWSGENQSYTGGVHVLVTTSSQYCLSDKRFSLLRDTCESFQLLRGRGVVWTAFSSGNPCFCRDIAMLSIAEYSFSHVARKALLDSSFAICLKSDHTAENVYVLELFLPSKTANPRQVLESVLLTMKKHLNGFRLASGKQLGDEMHVEVLRVSMDDKLDFFRLFHAAVGSVELQDRHNSSMHPVMLTGLGICAIHNASFAAIEEQESLELLQDDKHDSFTFFNAVDGSVEQQDHHNSSRHQQLLSGKNSASNCKRTDRETLEKHFNLKRKEAAQHLNMCESTLKRNCRAVGIKVWPYKKNQATCSPTGIESNKGNEKHDPKYGQEGLNSNMSTEEGTTSSQQNISQDAMGSGGSMMTIKAVYRGKTIKFRLPFNSSKLVDMETEVASRLKLKVGDFDIWYPDEDDDWIVLTCDVDLRIMESMGKTTITVYITDAAGDPIKGLAMEHLILE